MLDAYMLARMQFAANITFHILFPSLTIGLSFFLCLFKVLYNKTKSEKWMKIYFFWTKIFALGFGLGVVSGVTMSFQFGTNWPGFMNKVGSIAGPLLAYEVMSAFFLESMFLGIMLFGFYKVPSWLHNISTFLVFFGTLLSAFWILSLNSWMHTPDGYAIINDKIIPIDWWKVIFNPSFPYRFFHTITGSFLTASFFIAGISSYRILKNNKDEIAHTCFKMFCYIAAFLISIQIIIGDLHGRNTLKHYPAEIAAMEGLWETKKGIPLIIFALVSEKEQKNYYTIEIPKLSSLILTHEWNGEVKGLKDFKEHPPVNPVFWGFRIMVGMGIIMFGVAYFFSIMNLLKRKIPKITHILNVPMTFSGWIASISGWYVTEIGRQPYLVHSLLKTSEAVSTLHDFSTMLFTFICYVAIYSFLFICFIYTIFYMARNDFEKINTEIHN